MRHALALTAVALLAIACSSVTTLTNGGGRVRVLEAAAARQCKLLGDVVKQNTNSWQERPVSEEDARNKVLNEAAAMGGTHIVSHGYVSHLPSTCEDCVQLTADVYRCDGRVADQSVAEAFAPPPVPPPAASTNERNHEDHDAACAAFAGGQLRGEACQFDTECMICHDGSDCGAVVSRATFIAKGAACNLQDAAECEAAAPRCCQGVCVRAGF